MLKLLQKDMSIHFAGAFVALLFGEILKCALQLRALVYTYNGYLLLELNCSYASHHSSYCTLLYTFSCSYMLLTRRLL